MGEESIESSALLAVMAGDHERAKRLLHQMEVGALRELLVAARIYRLMVDDVIYEKRKQAEEG